MTHRLVESARLQHELVQHATPLELMRCDSAYPAVVLFSERESESESEREREREREREKGGDLNDDEIRI